MPIKIRNNKIFLIRPYVETVQLSGDNLINRKFEEKIVIREDQLDIPVSGVVVLHDYYGTANSLRYSYTWIKNSDHLFFIKPSSKGKDFLNPIVKKTSLKKQFLHEVEVIDKFFVKTKTEVFYVGKKLRNVDAASFQSIEHTQFYQDDVDVYSYTETDGLARISIPPADRFFIPYCWYFADRSTVYHQSSWTEKIEPISGELGTQCRSNLDEVLTKNGKMEGLSQAKMIELFAGIRIYEDLFNYFFPDANATWNVH